MNIPDHISESLESFFWVKNTSIFDADPVSGIRNFAVLLLVFNQEALLASCGPWGKVGFSKAMSAGWIQIDKSGTVPTGYRHPYFQ
jgi:hypothetical protein